MVFREIPMFEVREVLRLWLSGRGYRTIESLVRSDHKTIRRIVEAAVVARLRGAPVPQLLSSIGSVRPLMEGSRWIVCTRPSRQKPPDNATGW